MLIVSCENNNNNHDVIKDKYSNLSPREVRKLKVQAKVEEINDTRDKLNVLVDKIYKEEVKELNQLLNTIEKENESAFMKNIRIPDTKLEYWVLKLPIYIDRINERTEYRALDVDIAEAIRQEHWDTAYLEATKRDMPETKGFKVQEKKAVANTETIIDNYTYIIKNRIYKKIKARVETADKVFYSVKAILGKRL